MPTGPGAKNWVDQEGGLPEMVKRIAKHLKEKHPEWTKSHCIAVAIVAVKRMAATGDTNFKGKQNVGAKARARAQASASKWESMKARAHEHSNPVESGDNPFDLALSSDLHPGAAPNAKQKKPAKKDDGKGKDGGKQRYKHGWIPVDSNGKATGPAEPPPWLKDAYAKHKAAGGLTVQEKAAKGVKDKAEREHKHAQAEKDRAKRKVEAAKRKKDAAHKKRVNDIARGHHKAEAEKRHKAAEADRTHRKAESDRKHAENERDAALRGKEAELRAAYAQAVADQKAKRPLTAEQQTVIALYERKKAQRAEKLRHVGLSNEVEAGSGLKPPVSLWAIVGRAALRKLRRQA